MASRSDLAKLKKLSRFAGMSDKQLAKVADAGRFVHLPAQWSLMAETTPADKAYLLLEGEVEIRHQGEVVATAGPGDVIGEVGILEKRLRTASVVSLTELEVLHFTREGLRDLVDSVPEVGEALRNTARARLGESEDA